MTEKHSENQQESTKGSIGSNGSGEVPHFCIDVLAETWGQKNAQDPSTYKKIYRMTLGKQDASPSELNDSWFKHMIEFHSRTLGKEQATEVMEKLRSEKNCR